MTFFAAMVTLPILLYSAKVPQCNSETVKQCHSVEAIKFFLTNTLLTNEAASRFPKPTGMMEIGC